MFTKKSRCWASWTSFYLGPLTLNGIHYAEHGRAGTRSCSCNLCLGGFSHSVPCGATPWPSMVTRVVPYRGTSQGRSGKWTEVPMFPQSKPRCNIGLELSLDCPSRKIDKTGKLWPSLYWSSCCIQTLSFNLCSDTPTVPPSPSNQLVRYPNTANPVL